MEKIRLKKKKEISQRPEKTDVQSASHCEYQYSRGTGGRFSYPLLLLWEPISKHILQRFVKLITHADAFWGR